MEAEEAMKQAYLFVHFREKKTPDGEQVYFALSPDGFHWEAVNQGQPVLWSFKGDLGVRDMTIIKAQDGIFHIIATDLSLAYGMPGKYGGSWDIIKYRGSKSLMAWSSPDLIHWSKQREIRFDYPAFGCLWAPDILFDEASGDYLLHWSSTVLDGSSPNHAIWCSRTRDFTAWSPPELLYQKAGTSVIDSAMYREDDAYFLFVKSSKDPEAVIMLRGDTLSGPFETVDGAMTGIKPVETNKYEAPTAFRLEDGRWCLLIDYYGVPGKGQGYVPYLADSLASGYFKRVDEEFSFPYGFKHGTVLTITPEEYERLRALTEWPETAG